jgi:peroxiredoxin
MSSNKDLHQLPDNLPIPVDDGACLHLTGLRLPNVSLASTAGSFVDLAGLGGAWVVVYCYPLTGAPGVALPTDWDEIPGARGCTPQSCSFRDLFGQLAEEHATVYGLSTQSTDYQREVRNRLHLPFELLSDFDLSFVRQMRLPTFFAEGSELVKRVTIIARDGIIRKVFYPVFPPTTNAEKVLDWLRTANGRSD